VTRFGRVIVAAALLALVVAGLSGCSPSKAGVAAQQQQQCFSNERQIKTATDLVHADTGIYPDVASVTSKLDLKCPAGGTYTFDPNTDIVSCSIHGHPQVEAPVIP
jgi:hypothetical protein